MKKIIYNLKGNFQCASPARDDDDFMKFVMSKDVPSEATDVTIVDEKQIPTDRFFRDAWVVSDGKVEIDVQKARKIRLDQIRRERNELLDKTDKAFISRLERGDSLIDLKQKRQKLRDVPQSINLSGMNCDELRSFDPFDGLR